MPILSPFRSGNLTSSFPLTSFVPGRKCIVVGHGNGTNPHVIYADCPNLEVVLLPGSARIVSPLKLCAMFEFHATDQAIVKHNLIEQKVAMHSELPIDNRHCIALHYVLQAWRTVLCGRINYVHGV